jgi:uncharacterized protein YkwD
MVIRYTVVLFVAVCAACTVAVAGFLLSSPAAEAQATGKVNVRSCTGGQVSLKPAESQMLNLHNQRRASQNRPRLCVHPALQRAARAHSADMIRRDYFAHGNVGQRLRRHGYNWSTYGENIIQDLGGPTARGSFNRWMRSPSHRSNIMNGRFREVGIGYATGTYKGGTSTMWTADFGNRR